MGLHSRCVSDTHYCNSINPGLNSNETTLGLHLEICVPLKLLWHQTDLVDMEENEVPFLLHMGLYMK